MTKKEFDAWAEHYTPTEQVALIDRYAKHPDIKLRDMADLKLFELLEMARGVQREYVGIDGISIIYGCCRKTAQKIKNEGRLEPAIHYIGKKKFTIDILTALQIMPRSHAMGKNRNEPIAF